MRFLTLKRYLPLLLIAPSILWIYIDKSLWTWDTALYGTESIHLFRLLIQQPAEYITSFFTVLDTKAPMICWLGQFFTPLGVFIGYEKALLLMQIVASLGMVYTICSLPAFSRTSLASITVIFLTCSTPFFICQSHFYFVEVLQTLGVIWIFKLFIERKTLPIISLTVAYISTFFFLLGTKVTSPIYILLPSIFILLEIFQRRGEMQWKNIKAVPNHSFFLLMLVTILVSVWYLRNFSNILTFAQSASHGAISLYYGEKTDLLTKSIYWLTHYKNIFWGGRTAFIFEILTGLSLFIYWRKVIDLPFVIALGQTFLILVLFSLQINEEIRYLYPLFIYLIYIVGKIITQNKAIMLIFICLLGFRLAEFQLGTLGFIPLKLEMKWADSPDREGKNLAQSIAIIQLLLAHHTQKPVIFAVDTRELNPVALQFVYFTQYPSAKHYPIYSIGYAQTDEAEAIKKINDLKIEYLITLPLSELKKLDDFLNRVALVVTQKMQQQGWKNFSEGEHYLILKRPGG